MVVAANNSLNKGGADFVVADDATNAQDIINDAIDAIPLSAEVSGSVSSVILCDQVPIMTSNTTPSGSASASSVNSFTGTSNIIPTMTSNTTPSGVASASTVYSSYAAWQAMDKNASTYWKLMVYHTAGCNTNLLLLCCNKIYNNSKLYNSS